MNRIRKSKNARPARFFALWDEAGNLFARVFTHDGERFPLSHRMGEGRGEGNFFCAFRRLPLLIALIWLCAPPPASATKVKYTYDSANRLVAADYGGGKVTVFTYDKNGNRVNRSTIIATNADVRLTKTSSTATPNVGVVFSYTLTVTNAGPNPATGVTIADTVPFGTILHSASPSQGAAELSGRTVIAQFGVLPVGSSAGLALSVRHGFTNSFTNIATVVANEADSNLANNSATNVTTATLPSFGFDSDGDGMPGWWEALNISSGAPFTDFGANGPNGHADTDGVRNFDEWIADTRANDANSFFYIEAFSVGSGVATLEFQSSPIRRYRAQFTPELVSQPLTNLITFEGDGSVMSVIHTNASGGFYRLQAELP